MTGRFSMATAALLLTAAAAGDARADSYVGGSIGTAQTYPALAELEISDYNMAAYGFGTDCVSLGCTSDQNKPEAWKVFLGARTGPNFAVEAFYAQLGKYDSFADDGAGVTATVNAEIETAGIAGLAVAPLSHNMALFAKFGVHAWRMEGVLDLNDGVAPFAITETFETNGSGLMIGVGAEFDLTEHVALRAEYEGFGGKTDGGDFAVGLLSVGAVMRF